MEYLVIIERGVNGVSAYVPDLPGCIAAGETLDEVRALIHEAIDMHLEDMREQGLDIPPPTLSAEVVHVA